MKVFYLNKKLNLKSEFEANRMNKVTLFVFCEGPSFALLFLTSGCRGWAVEGAV